MEKSYRKYTQKASLRPLLGLLNNPKQQLPTRNSFKNKIFERGYQKP